MKCLELWASISCQSLLIGLENPPTPYLCTMPSRRVVQRLCQGCQLPDSRLQRVPMDGGKWHGLLEKMNLEAAGSSSCPPLQSQ